MNQTGSSNTEPTSRFLRACHRLPVDATPIWLMRQAGRYMAEYRALRETHSMLELIRTPELATEVTLQPVNAFDLDAAIIFADILPPLIGIQSPQVQNRPSGFGIGPKSILSAIWLTLSPLLSQP